MPRALAALLALVLPLSAADLLTAPGAAAATQAKPEVTRAEAFEGNWAPGADGLRPVPCNALMGHSDLTMTAGLRDNDGGTVTAQFVVTTAAGKAVPVSNGATTVSSGGTATAKVLDENLPTGAYKWKVRARDKDGNYSAFTSECAFSVDAIAPVEPVTVTVTKEDGTPVTVQPARTKLRLKFKHPAADLAGFCWFMDSPVSVNRCDGGGGGGAGTWTPVADGATEATVEVILAIWPRSTLNVFAVDKAGNQSPGDATTVLNTSRPSFIYPAGQTPLTTWGQDLLGDLNGDGFTDLLSPEPDGGLRLYAGNGTGRVQMSIVGDSGWKDALIAHGGDFAGLLSFTDAPDGFEDAVVRLGDGKLYLYAGNGLGGFSHAKRMALAPPKDLGSKGWGRVQQIIAPGDLDQRTEPGYRKGDDLAAIECVDDACSGARLRIYSGQTLGGGGANQTAPFDFQNPAYTGGSTWKNYTVLAIGDQNGDGVKDVLSRNKTDGNLYLYAGKIGADGKFGLASRTAYATGGWQSANRPLIASHGNTQGTIVSKTITDDEGRVIAYKQFQPKAGDEQGDVWATTRADPNSRVNYVNSAGMAASTTCPTGCLLFYPGGPTALKAPLLIGASNWSTSITNIF
ncbi:hypothetical protein OTB20_20700 [Streptomyces sp. H27-H1]|nr:hypothetical protein [Streptomyces sp. H27-H1]